MSTRAEQIQLQSALNKDIRTAQDFYRESHKDNSVTVDTITVNESAVMPTVVKNPQRYPLKVAPTEDTKKSYKNHTFVTNPVVISKENEFLTSFNKRANEASKHSYQLINDFAETVMYEWAATLTAQHRRTTGAGTGALIGAMTGTRKAIVKADILAIHRIMDQNGVPKNGRVAICDHVHFYELLEIAGISEFQLSGLVDPWIEGDLPRRLGLKRLYVRDRVAWYDNTGTPVKQLMIDEAVQDDILEQKVPITSTNLAMHFWHAEYVRHSFGNSFAYVENGGTRYKGGTLLNAEVRGGAMISRLDEKGVVALIQTTV